MKFVLIVAALIAIAIVAALWLTENDYDELTEDDCKEIPDDEDY